MSDIWTDDDLNDILGEPSGDNSTIKVLREKIKADGKAMAEMRSQLEKLSTMSRTPLVEQALKSAGLTPLAAQAYTGDADPTAIQAWVEANKGWIAPAGAQPQQTIDDDPPSGAGAPSEGTAEPVFTPDSQAAYQRMITAGVDGVPGTNFQNALGALQSADSMEALLAAIQQHQ